MNTPFNPYRQWLDLDVESAPSHYRLIGLADFEADAGAIAAAADAALAKVRSHRPGPNGREWGALLDQLAMVRRTLLDPELKSAYDAELRLSLETPQAPQPAPAQPEPAPFDPAKAYMWPPGMGPAPAAQAAAEVAPSSAPLGSAAPAAAATAGWQTGPTEAESSLASVVPVSPAQASNQPPLVATLIMPGSTAPAGAPQAQPVSNQAGWLPLPSSPAPAQPTSLDPMAPVAIDQGGPVPLSAAPAPIAALAPVSAAPLDPMAPVSQAPAAVGSGWGAGGYGAPMAAGTATWATASPVALSASPVYAAPAAPQAAPLMVTPAAAPLTAVPIAGSPLAAGSGQTVQPLASPVAIASAEAASPISTGSDPIVYRSGNRSSAMVYVAVIAAAGLLFAAMLTFVGGNRNDQAKQVAQPAQPPAGANHGGSRPPQRLTRPAAQTQPKPKPDPAPPRRPVSKTVAIGPRVDLEPKPRPTPEPQPAPEPAPMPEPQPEPKPAPKPKPEPPAAATPEQRAAFRQAIVAAMAALGDRDVEAAERKLKEAQPLAIDADQRLKLEGMQTVAEGVGHFWHAVRETTGQLRSGEEVTIGSTKVLIVESSPQKLSIRLAGRNRSYAPRDLPAGLAVALARLWFDGSAASTKIFIGSFLLADPNGDREEARRLWQEAGASGEDIDHLLPLLDENWDEP